MSRTKGCWGRLEIARKKWKEGAVAEVSQSWRLALSPGRRAGGALPGGWSGAVGYRPARLPRPSRPAGAEGSERHRTPRARPSRGESQRASLAHLSAQRLRAAAGIESDRGGSGCRESETVPEAPAIRDGDRPAASTVLRPTGCVPQTNGRVLPAHPKQDARASGGRAGPGSRASAGETPGCAGLSRASRGRRPPLFS